MRKIGILTFHYSNNYGGVLQALSLQNAIKLLGYDVEIINFIPSNYKPTKIVNNLGLSKNIFRNEVKDFNIINLIKKISIMKNYSGSITDKFNTFRNKEMKLSKQVDENSIETILNNYDAIIVGSDQVWNPSQRKSPVYFLDFGDNFNGKKISYAADSTIEEIDDKYRNKLENALVDFSYISVRNEHSYEFVKSLTNKEAVIVADPTIIYDFKVDNVNAEKNEDYILTYVLGKEIEGTHVEALEKIKKTYGDLPVYSIKIPTMKFELSNFADKVFYDLNPAEWLNMFRNAKFIYTDSYHGVLFSLKFHKPFLAYYTELMRATRFIDMGKRYNIEKYLVENVQDIEKKKSLEVEPDFDEIDKLLKEHKRVSMKYIEDALS